MHRDDSHRTTRGSRRPRAARGGALLAVGVVACVVALTAPAPSRAVDTFEQSGAVLINVTEQDLNLILRSLVRASGGPEIEGRRKRATRGIEGLQYRALITEPVLTLGEPAAAHLAVGIREGGIEVGRVERQMGKRVAYCEDLAAVVKRPIDVEMEVAFRIEADDLHLVPGEISISKPKKSFKLIKPARCVNTPLPKWLLWWIGKGKIRKRLGKLDDVLLESARRSAAGLNEGDGFLRKRWEHEAHDGGPAGFLEIRPEWVRTRDGRLTVSLASSGSGAPAAPAGSTSWIDELSDRSFVAISESFLKTYLHFAVSDVSETPRKPSGDYKRLFKSSSVYALIPGLRDLENKDELSISFALRSTPDIQIGSVTAREMEIDPGLRAEPDRIDESRAVIRVLLSDIEMMLWRGADDPGAGGPELVGTLSIDSGVVAVAPFLNTIGGVSFALVENDWELSSSGIDFNEALFAATLQELIFGEVFETHYDPVWTDALTVGDTQFTPRFFRSVDGYLVVELAGAASPEETQRALAALDTGAPSAP